MDVCGLDDMLSYWETNFVPKFDAPHSCMNEPLKNMRHERFCQLYAGKCFGYAGRAYKAVFKCKANSADESGYRLLRNVQIWNRIKYLREDIRQHMAVDAAKILTMRMQIAKDGKARKSDKLTALKDVERSLGLELPSKMELSGAVKVDLSKLSDDQLKSLVDLAEE
jgi:hypothetical protein